MTLQNYYSIKIFHYTPIVTLLIWICSWIRDNTNVTRGIIIFIIHIKIRRSSNGFRSNNHSPSGNNNLIQLHSGLARPFQELSVNNIHFKWETLKWASFREFRVELPPSWLYPIGVRFSSFALPPVSLANCSRILRSTKNCATFDLDLPPPFSNAVAIEDSATRWFREFITGPLTLGLMSRLITLGQDIRCAIHRGQVTRLINEFD